MKRCEMHHSGFIGKQTLAATGLFLACASALAAPPSLTPWQTIAGARIEAAADMMAPPQRKPGFIGFLGWMSPGPISGQGTFFFVFDSGRQQIFRYDLAQQTMTTFAPYPSPKVASLAVAPDLSVYVADTGTQKVTHFSRDGRPLQTFSNPRELARPVAVVVDGASNDVWVADSLYGHVAVFNSLGLLLRVIKPAGVRSIAAIARGPGGLYLVDAVGRQIVVVGADGQKRGAFGADSLKDPAAIAVDRHGRVFVADNFDHTIKIYMDGRLAETFAGNGTAAAMFSRIGGIWLEENFLYVTDTLGGRVQSFRVAPPVGEESKDELPASGAGPG